MSGPTPRPAAPLAPPADTLALMLGRAGVTCAATALEAAVAQLGPSYRPERLVEWVRAVLARAGIRGVWPVAMAWGRFDTGQLPAWVWHDGRWQEALGASGGDGVRLRDAGGEPQDARTVAAADLRRAPVLWLRVQAARAEQTLSASPSARLVLRELMQDSGWLWRVALATVGVNVLAMASSLYAMQVYDRVVPTLAYSTLATLSVGMLIAIGMEAVLKTSRARILDSLACAVDGRLSRRVFSHLMEVRLDAMPRSVGTLAAQVGGLDAVRQFLSSATVFGVVDVPFAVLFLVVIAVVGGPVAWVYALALPAGLVLGWLAHRRLKALVQAQVARNNERQGVLVDAVRGAESIRAAQAGWRFEQEWQDISERIEDHAIRHKALHADLGMQLGVLSTLAYVAAIVAGVWEVETGRMSSGAMVACTMLGSRVIAPVVQAVQYLAQWEGVSQALAMVDAILALPRQRPGDQPLLSPDFSRVPVQLEAQQLRYAYPGSPLVHVQVPGTLTLRAGERVLLLGPVGCGKSTLLKLLAGLYAPAEGRVRLAGADLQAMDPQVMASELGYLPQDACLFKGTLRANLTLSGVSADEQVEAVSRLLGLDRIAGASPRGMDREIAEGGAGLSTGQRQLVALARLLLAQPRVMLLDEPTASLDGEAEARAWQALAARTGPGDIVVVATHKPQAALAWATRVVVMRDGGILRDGHPRDVFPAAFRQPPQQDR